MTNLNGQSLGRYHILEQLGEGGMATVYKAYDTRLESDVAVKVIRTENLAPSILNRSLKRFEREAKSLAKLTHANIVNVLDYGEHEGKPYLVMPYLPGGTLKAKLNGRPVPWQEAARILLPIARALGYAHEQGMIHRDVKPANILITHSGDPMLTDFGIAKIIDEEATQDLTGTSAAVGTPEYMAPEQVTAKSVDHRADIYALGVVFYEMVTGRKPFQADTPMAVLFKHASEPLPRPSQFLSSLPDSVEKILIKALAKRAEDRYANMAEMAVAFEKLIQGTASPQSATPDHHAQKPATNGRQNTLGNDFSTIDESPRLTPQTRRWWQSSWALILGGLVIIFFLGLGAVGLYNLGALNNAAKTSDNVTEPIVVPDQETVSTQTRQKDGMLMVYIPAGDFIMGSDNGSNDEKPPHTVNLDGFWIDQTEVTNAMYAQFLNEQDNQSQDGVYWLDAEDPDVRIHKSGGRWQAQLTYVNHPVIEVSWYGAAAYCAWVGGRLSTEAEWEKAARGADQRVYPWGDDSPTCAYANYSGCFGATRAAGMHPAGASPYGILDMAGNAWEWVADWHAPDYYTSSPTDNPTGPASGSARVLRGGSWQYADSFIRTTHRYKSSPDTSNDYIGFRCVLPQY